MERFVIIVNGFQPLTIITKPSILDVAAALDPPLVYVVLTVAENTTLEIQFRTRKLHALSGYTKTSSKTNCVGGGAQG